MFRISYIDIATNQLKHKGGFLSDKAAYEWANKHESEIVPLRLLIWSEAIQCYKEIETL